jgi:hypothetical protein
MMLAAVETVTKADPVWESRSLDSNVAAQATARESVHDASCYPRPTNGIFVAITVRNWTLASIGRLAMYKTALAT